MENKEKIEKKEKQEHIGKNQENKAIIRNKYGKNSEK